MPYPDHLKENMPMICPKFWVVDQVREKYDVSSRYPRVEDDALNIGIGSIKLKTISLCSFLTS
jgi:hypothetical protein